MREASPAPTPADFVFRLHDFNWELQGSTVYQLSADGTLLHLYPVSQRVEGSTQTEWHEARTTLPPDAVAEFRGLLDAFGALRPRYVDPEVDDGEATTFWLRTDAGLQEVSCQNRCDPAAIATLTWLRERATRIPEPHTPRPGLRPGQAWEGAADSR
ncbi:MAG: hypothetical protein AB8I08_23535 [Sandaracinaceae bacterium]